MSERLRLTLDETQTGKDRIEKTVRALLVTRLRHARHRRRKSLFCPDKLQSKRLTRMRMSITPNTIMPVTIMPVTITA